MGECAYIITCGGKWVGELTIEVDVPGDGLYRAAKGWARVNCQTVAGFQKYHPGDYAVAVLTGRDKEPQTIHVEVKPGQ
jgi:hypothetical protein